MGSPPIGKPTLALGAKRGMPGRAADVVHGQLTE